MFFDLNNKNLVRDQRQISQQIFDNSTVDCDVFLIYNSSCSHDQIPPTHIIKASGIHSEGHVPSLSQIGNPSKWDETARAWATTQISDASQEDSNGDIMSTNQLNE